MKRSPLDLQTLYKRFCQQCDCFYTQSDPFAMLVESSKKLEGNARFEGINIDVAMELAKLLGFNFTIKLVDDGNVREISQMLSLV